MESILIIGGGPAGLTAAIYAARANFKPLVIEGAQPGGQLMITSEIENFPGFPEGISGPELMDRMRRQAERFGSRHVYDAVSRVDFQTRPFKVWAGDEMHETKTAIIATGATARWLNLPSEERLKGRGVSACATCDGFFFKDKDLVVVGGGDTAMEEATFLTHFARMVTVVHRRERLRASPIMQEKARQNQKIQFRWNSVVEQILGTESVVGVRLRNVVDNTVSDLPVDGVFVAVGHTPNTGVFKGQLHMDENGYLLVTECTMTSIPGVFAAGDVADPRYRQATSAVGSGCRSAIDAQRFLELT